MRRANHAAPHPAYASAVRAPSRSLNMRQLLTPLFYGGGEFPLGHGHPDSSRQRKARQAAKDRRAARRLKSRYVPLCFVDRTMYLERRNHDDRLDCVVFHV